MVTQTVPMRFVIDERGLVVLQVEERCEWRDATEKDLHPGLDVQLGDVAETREVPPLRLASDRDAPPPLRTEGPLRLDTSAFDKLRAEEDALMARLTPEAFAPFDPFLDLFAEETHQLFVGKFVCPCASGADDLACFIEPSALFVTYVAALRIAADEFERRRSNVLDVGQSPRTPAHHHDPRPPALTLA